MEDDERAQIMINTKNIDSLNCAKGIACIFVILIHCTFPGIVGEMLRAIARFAVPLFFTVTGYFLLDSHGKVTRARILPETEKKKTFWSQIINLTWIYVLFSVTLWIFKMIFSDNVNTQFGVRDLLMIPIKPLGEFWYIYVLIFIYLIAYIRVYTRTEK